MSEEQKLQPVGEVWPARRPCSRSLRAVDGEAIAVASTADRDLFWYRDVIRRRWRTALVTFGIVLSGVAAGLLMQDPTYRATSLMEIRRESTGAVPVETLFAQERISTDELETQFGILKSLTLAQRVVEEVRSSPTGVDADPLTVEALREGLTINPLKGSRLVEVSFISSDPQLSVRVVNAVLDHYLKLRMEEARRSVEWLETQLGNAQERLEDSERRLRTYVQEHGLAAFETGKGETAMLVNERLKTIQESLARAEAERMAKQSEYEQARKLAAARDLDSPVVQEVSMRLTELRREYAKLATTFHDEYPAVQAIKSQIAALERALTSESERAARSVTRAYEAAVRREGLLRQALEDHTATVQALGQSGIGYESLTREVVTNQQLFATLNQKLKEVSISAALKAANVGIVDRPTLPRRPDKTPLMVSLGLAGVLGLLLAFGGIVLQEHVDTTMRSEDDVEDLGVPTLATIPAYAPEPRRLQPPPGQRSWRRIDQESAQQSPLGEAFAALRAAVLLRDNAAQTRSLLVTSAHSAEGKTTVSINLALSLAKLKHRVLLVDANLRFPCVQRVFGLPDGPGLVEYLSGNEEVFWGAYVHAEALPNVDILLGGTPDVSPADLLSLPRLRHLIQAASRTYDYVILDSPAMLAHPADIRSLASVVDDVLLTVRHGTTPREAVSFVLARLPHVLGIVINRSDSRDIPIYYRDVTTRSA